MTNARSGRPRHAAASQPLFAGRSAIALLCAVLGVAGATSIVTSAANAADSGFSAVALDNYARSDAGGWGQAEVGGTWELRGQTSAFEISGAAGTVRALQPGASAGASLTGVSTSDTLVQSLLVVPPVDPGSINLHDTLEVRRQADGSTYRGRLRIKPGGSFGVAVSRTEGNTETSLASAVLPLQVAAGQQVWLQVEATGSNPVVVAAKVWLVGTATPDWQVTVSDSSDARISGAGRVGIWDYVSTASVPTTLVHDSFQAFAVGAPAAPLPSPTPTPAPPAPAPALTSSGTVYKAANFDNMALGAVDPAKFISALGNTNKNAGAYDDMTIVPSSRGGNAVRTTLKAGTIHSAPIPDGGDNLFIQLPSSYDQACMQYDIKFDANFDWSMGGKLPGLEGVAPGTSPSTPTGGDRTEMGWSGRLMWLGPKAYSWAGPTNMAVSYMYHSGQAGTYGDNVRWNKAFVAGAWHQVKQCYTMNTIGMSNGKLLAWMDGVQVVNDTAFKYRSRSDVHINYLLFSLFRGGSTMSWSGSRTGTVDIDNVRITNV